MSNGGGNYIGGIFGNRGIITQGQTGNNYIGAIPRRMSDPRAEQLKQELLALPRDKLVSVETIMGNSEAIQFADDIAQFLASNGYKIKGMRQSMFSGPVTGVTAKQGDKFVEILVGAQ